ncbi:MAG: hypothetical protein ABI919_07920 [Ramlibacter sp.]
MFEQALRVIGEVQAKPVVGDLLFRQYRVLFSLAECTVSAQQNHGVLPWAVTAAEEHLEALVFAWRVVQLADAARLTSFKRQTIFLHRVREAIRSPHVLKAFQMEATIATHFVAAGRRVVFPELNKGTETYDILIEDLGPNGLEIECKVVTCDKGRSFHQQEAQELLHRVAVSPFTQGLAHGTKSFAVRILATARLPDRSNWDKLCAGIERVILSASNEGVLDDGTVIQMFEFDASILGPIQSTPTQQMQDAVEQVTGVRNRPCVFTAPKGSVGGIAVVVLDSRQPDNMLDQLFDTFTISAGKQLTGTRAGALFAIFEGVGIGSVAELGSGTALEWKASAFLESAPPHVIGVGFLSEPDYSNATAASGGTTFWIPKRTSPLWHENFSGLFGKDLRAELKDL